MDIPWTKVELMNANKKLLNKVERYEKALNEIETGYRGSGIDLDEALDKHFYGGESPVRNNK